MDRHITTPQGARVILSDGDVYVVPGPRYSGAELLLARALDLLNDHPRFVLRRDRRVDSYTLAADIGRHLERAARRGSLLRRLAGIAGLAGVCVAIILTVLSVAP